MATPQELMAIDDAKKAKAKAVVAAKAKVAKGPANDNDLRRIDQSPLVDEGSPDGYFEVDGQMMPYWLGPVEQRRDIA